jgi:hypothetical protein
MLAPTSVQLRKLTCGRMFSGMCPKMPRTSADPNHLVMGGMFDTKLTQNALLSRLLLMPSGVPGRPSMSTSLEPARGCGGRKTLHVSKDSSCILDILNRAQVVRQHINRNQASNAGADKRLASDFVTYACHALTQQPEFHAARKLAVQRFHQQVAYKALVLGAMLDIVSDTCRCKALLVLQGAKGLFAPLT